MTAAIKNSTSVKYDLLGGVCGISESSLGFIKYIIIIPVKFCLFVCLSEC